MSIPKKYQNLNHIEIEELVDIGLRHKSNVTTDDYKDHFLSIARDFGYATKDDSWGEFEKLFAIIINRLISAEELVDMEFS